MPRKSAVSSKNKFVVTKAKILLLGGTLLFGLLLLLLLLLPGYQVSEGFKTLAEVEKYAQAFDEPKISMENTNLVKPDYTKFYQGQQKGFFGRKLQRLGLARRLPWTAHTYQNYLEQLVKIGKEKNYTGNFTHKIVPGANAKIVAWGDVQGAFHSITRDLRELVKQQILDENLKVCNPEYYLIFIGDVTSRSPFLMETISLVARLMLNNPENVFYIRGNHESSNYWQGHGLKTELKIRAANFSSGKEEFPLEQLTNNFFDTLPTAIYIGAQPNPEKQFIRFSHEGIDGESKIGEINDLKMAPFLGTKIATGKLATLNYKDLKEGASAAPIENKAILKAEVKRKTYQSMDGLRLTSPENGVTTWTMLSCPTEVYRKGLEYFYDAFVVIQVGAKIEDWTITLYNQDIRKPEGFKAARTLSLITGQLLSGTPAAGAPENPPAAPAPQPTAPAVAPATTASPAPATTPAPVVTLAPATPALPLQAAPQNIVPPQTPAPAAPTQPTPQPLAPPAPSQPLPAAASQPQALAPQIQAPPPSNPAPLPENRQSALGKFLK